MVSMEGEEMPGDSGAGVKETSGRDGGLGQSRAEALAGCLDRGAWQVRKKVWTTV